MAWKSSIPLIASGAAAAGALVWLGQPLFRRLLGRLKDTSRNPGANDRQGRAAGAKDPHEGWAPHEAWDTPALREAPGALFVPLVDDPARAQDDALRDVEDDLAFALDALSDPDEIDAPESAESVHPASHPRPADEPYDALDAEDFGRQWLLRATQAPAPDEPPPEESLEGVHGVMEPESLDDLEDEEEARRRR